MQGLRALSTCCLLRQFSWNSTHQVTDFDKVSDEVELQGFLVFVFSVVVDPSGHFLCSCAIASWKLEQFEYELNGFITIKEILYLLVSMCLDWRYPTHQGINILSSINHQIRKANVAQLISYEFFVVSTTGLKSYL